MNTRTMWLAGLVCGGALLLVTGCTRPETRVCCDGDHATGTPVSKEQEKGQPDYQGKPAGGAEAEEQTAKAPQEAPPTKGGEDKPQPAPVPYEFPGDKGGALMQRLLTPRDNAVTAQTNPAPARRKPLRHVEDPVLLLSRAEVGLPRVSNYGPAAPVRPVFVLPESILGDAGFTLALPEEQTMPTGPLLKVPSPDVNKPISLPPMAQAVSGREPLTDPTKAASAEAAARGPMPTRTKPAPFVPEVVPDPFENEAAVRKLAPPAEESLPLGSGSQPVKK